jgi:hypothetical protein
VALDSTQLGELAAAAAVTLAPFTPYLVKAGEKAVEEVGKKVGGVAWEKAQAVWAKIKARFGDDKEIDNAVGLVATDPDDEDYRATLAKVLGKKLAAQPDLADDLVALLGGFDAVQEMTARAGGVIVRAAQKATGVRARQTMTAEGKGSGIFDATQTAE